MREILGIDEEGDDELNDEDLDRLIDEVSLKLIIHTLY